jgi:hypothetical protein
MEMRKNPALVENSTVGQSHLCAALDHIMGLAKPALALARWRVIRLIMLK